MLNFNNDKFITIGIQKKDIPIILKVLAKVCVSVNLDELRAIKKLINSLSSARKVMELARLEDSINNFKKTETKLL